jgi:hypothetical protein
MKPQLKWVISCLAMAMLAYSALAEDGDMEQRKYPIMAAYVYNLTQFTVWPADVPGNRFALCVLGKSPFGELLTPLKDKTARGNNFSLVYLPSATPAIRDCDVLFITESQKENMASILTTLKNSPVLTVSNIDGFAEAGGIVEFARENTRIALRINIQAMRDARLSISSKLLSLARIINE